MERSIAATVYKEYRDARRCAACGGRCCAIYLSEDEGGSMPAGIKFFNEWADWWEELFRRSGAFEYAPPLFDVYRAVSDPVYRSWIVRQGGHPDCCPYWRRDGGCILQWERRPAVCREYRCGEWNFLEEEEEEKT